MSATADFLNRVAVRHPIIQAPMVGVSTPALAAAVSNAGGLGSIGLGGGGVDEARAAIGATRALTSAPFNVNLFCHRPAVADPAREAAWLAELRPLFAEFGAQPPTVLREPYQSFIGQRAMLDMLLAERPAVVSFHFGLPSQEWIRELRASGSVTLASATTLAEAQAVEAAGIDIIVAQGVEAGGHRGMFEPEAGDALLGTVALLRLLAGKVKAPVVAAGGIMDGAGIAAALQLGAAAVQLGTAFVLAPESAANAAYRAAMKSAAAYRTRLTAAISGRAARGLPNRFDDLPGTAVLPDYPIAYDAAKALHAAASARGCSDFAPHWAGQGAPLAREMPAAQIVAELVREWQAVSR
ncbi:NAD(P)H-dependent flavin oxidoreductase [Azoarcus olearius]|uniref:Nitronate monooxygenase n=1 Tax=Azoarcus sp. (strain BH72) TaxID=418699 RepID=A1K4M0_AZOSB|nr:nitronate monooxygenase [Azoarcus olearius]CAL93775.1 probable 2-nitropropane dioxygenase [Azoarcus olearius]